jgi:hypothetical protein
MNPAESSKVVRRERWIKVTMSGVSLTREYADDWCAKRAEDKLLKHVLARVNFFRRAPR